MTLTTHPLIQVKDLHKSFGQFDAVNGLSFTVNQGDIYGFLGQNGAGKSTTLRMLLTLIMPTSGHIEMFGYQLPHHRTDILRRIGAIIERPDLYKYLSAYQNLDLFARMSGLKLNRGQLLNQLEKVGLQHRAHSTVGTFSQGMKQRLGIAIAMVHDPALIILDEPTNGLDPQGIADMRQLIISLRETHQKTVIVSSHLLHEIEQVATRMIIIDKGKKIVEGAITDLFDPADTMVEVDCLDDDALSKIQQSAWSGSLVHAMNPFVFRVHAQHVPALARTLVELDIPIGNFSRRHSLEQLFLQLTGKEN